MTNNPDALDDRITDVARRMTAAEPPADFSARVLAQLRPRRASFQSWWLAPACLAAAAAIAVVLIRDGRAQPSPTATGSPMSMPAPAAATADTVTGLVPSLKPRATNLSTRTAGTRLSADELAWHARAVPELIASDPIAIAPIQPSALAIPLLEVAPIAAEPLRGSAGNVNRER